MPVIEASALTKVYPGVVAVDALDLEVEQGEVFGFLGPNGAGKSTTIRLLLDLARPTSGSARVFGLDVRRDAPEIHRRIGFLPSEPALPRDLTGKRYLDFMDELRGVPATTGRHGLAERLGADLSRRLADMSTGNRQKVAIIQAFMHEPALVLLDEPTRGLDPLVQRAFHDLLRERIADGATAFLSSHSLGEVDRVADRVGIIREGRLVAVETLRALKERATSTLELDLASEVDIGLFVDLPGVRDVSMDGLRLTARVQGSTDALLRTAVTATEVLAIRSAEADLEDIFLDFYRPAGVGS
jgi:ABC-2 type transport system ATP-binding protein